MLVIHARNVNEALPLAMGHLHSAGRRVAPRGAPTIEYPTPVTTSYDLPDEMVLFDPVRDANPFFHFFEALWILHGRKDVGFLKFLLPRMADFSDDGETFHAPYGYRLRHNFGFDQLAAVIDKLRASHDTRQAVMSIWDPALDFRPTKDVPCNDMVMLKIRDGALRMSVLNRSNDVLLGAYGANVVQFSTLMKYIAKRVGVKLGTYSQVSDSFHVYEDNPFWKHYIRNHPNGGMDAPPYTVYDSNEWRNSAGTSAEFMSSVDVFDGSFDTDLSVFFDLWDKNAEKYVSGERIVTPDMADIRNYSTDSFVETVCGMWQTLFIWRYRDKEDAVLFAKRNVAAHDWREAVVSWMSRRLVRGGE